MNTYTHVYDIHGQPSFGEFYNCTQQSPLQPPCNYPMLPDGTQFATGHYANMTEAQPRASPIRGLAAHVDPCGMWCMSQPPSSPAVAHFPTAHFTPLQTCSSFSQPQTLHQAAEGGLVDLARQIVMGFFGPMDINAQDSMGRTALHIAASSGNDELCELLLTNGCGTDIRDAWGRTALEVVEAISTRYASVTARLGGRQRREVEQNGESTEASGAAVPMPQSPMARAVIPESPPIESVECNCGNVISLKEEAKKATNEKTTCLTFCPSGHQLTIRDIGYNGHPRCFICDECNQRSFTDEFSLRCNLCDYDTCVSCTAEDRGIQCKNRHELRRFVSSKEDNYCDSCSKNYEQGTVFAACTDCNEFLCLACVGTKVF
eukprot:GDKK01043538.1.p1 GENE.GDKK01043538.1~~GDKK01043538.1.p1  ORF type:complete len:375 (+),score=4.10 GDKK01043538.1:50-1174(+)